MRAALRAAGRIVCCAHASYAGAVLAASPPEARFVFLGSTRKFTRWPDAQGTGVLAAETAFLPSRRSGVMLHPTTIYGAAGEHNVQRLAALLRWLPIVPLVTRRRVLPCPAPCGGRSLVQPIHREDVTRAIRAALDRDWVGPRSMVIAGPEAVSYTDFVRAVAVAAGLRRRWILPFSGRLLIALAPFSQWIRGLPNIRPEEVRRLLEDKVFDITEMRRVLGIEPIPLAERLARTF